MKTKTIHISQKLEKFGIFFGLSLIILMIILAIFAPVISPHDPLGINIQNKMAAASPDYPFGTDNLGRCIFSRVLYGARYSLTYAGILLAIMLAISIPLGLLCGYIGGKFDLIVMGIADAVMAFPSTIVALAVAGLLGPSAQNLILALSCVWWASYTRLIRGMTLEIKEKEFILAAKGSGCSTIKILLRYILKNMLSPLCVLAALEVGIIILSIAGFSFIGLGAQPPTPEWGVMMNDYKDYVQLYPQLMLYPGLFIAITVMGFSLFGSGLKSLLKRRDST